MLALVLHFKLSSVLKISNSGSKDLNLGEAEALVMKMREMELA